MMYVELLVESNCYFCVYVLHYCYHLPPFCCACSGYPVVICRVICRNLKLPLCRPEGVWRVIGTAVLILRLGTGWT